MNTKYKIAISAILAVFAASLPTVCVILLAKKQGSEAEMSHVMSYAYNVLSRSDRLADQIQYATSRLEKQGGADPCSVENIRLMRQIDLASSYIGVIGFLSSNRLACSSLGIDGGRLDLGDVDIVTPGGSHVWTNVRLPFAPNVSFILVERNGYAAAVHDEMPIDTTTSERDVTLASFNPQSQQVYAFRGYLNDEWMSRLNLEKEVVFIDQGFVVAAVRSEKYSMGAIAALPISHLEDRVRGFALFMLPIGLFAGLALVFTGFYLARQQLSLPVVLRSALRRDEFFLEYQPVVDLRSGVVVGAEVLLRWQRRGGQTVGPDAFIPVAEETDMILRITERVVDLIIRDSGDLFRRHPELHLAFNLSPADLHSRDTIALIQKLKEKTQARPGNLIIEATERGLLNADIVREVIREIRAGGVRVALDDFGTGYSNLAYLETFELDFLKIDRSFIETLGTEAPTSTVVYHIFEMTKDLGMEMVAEGVETEAQARILREKGVSYAQGWLYGKSMSFHDFISLVEKSQEELSEKWRKWIPPEIDETFMDTESAGV